MRYLALLVVVGCAADPEVVEPTLGGGAADAISDVTFVGDLAFGTPVNGAFTHDGQFDGYLVAVRAGAHVKLDITHGGSSMGLDTTLFVYGPRAGDGSFPTPRVAYDNDSSYGKLSRLSTTLDEAGTYAVIVGTRNGKGRGRYRLVPTCLSGDCAPAVLPLGACPAPIVAALQACVTDNLEHPYVELAPRLDLVEQCAAGEVLAPVFDGCGEPWCSGTFEAFYATYAQPCIRDARNAILDDWCVLGTTYGGLARQPSMTLVADTRLVASSPLTTLEKQQIVRALHASSHTDVTTAGEAFQRVDSGEIFQRHWWDASGRRAFVSYEYGAGDNSYGRIFAAGATATAADITDGDLLVCHPKYGAEIRDCTADHDCKLGVCNAGTCVNPAADTSPLEGTACTTQAACGVDTGLVCAGITRGEGLCGPAWQRRAFATSPQLAIPDNQPAGASVQLRVYGLATVDADVWLRASFTHTRPADLVITLTNPAGATVTVADGLASAELDVPVLGFSGDEEVNGTWTVTVRDKASARAGTLDELVLTVGSRWD